MSADEDNMNKAVVRWTEFVPRIMFIYFKDIFRLAYARAYCSALVHVQYKDLKYFKAKLIAS